MLDQLWNRELELHSTERAGIAYAVVGFATLSMGDAVVKSMAGEWPAVAVAAMRFAIAAVFLSALLWHKEGAAAFRPKNPWLQLARGVCLAFATASFFSAIYVMPLADAMAIAFLAPVLTQLLSGPLLGEKVRPAAWLVSLLALAGVAVVLRPNLVELGWQAILPLISATFFALMVIANRASAGQGSALSMQVFIAIIAAPILIAGAFISRGLGIEGLDFGWPSWDVTARCLIVACTASIAHWLAYIGTAKAGAAQIAPAIYVQLLVAITLGWWFFEDAPDAFTLIGAAMIIAAGLILWRDGKIAAREST
ncbi:MAG: DMT family transporter [Erythrobacter sp.]